MASRSFGSVVVSLLTGAVVIGCTFFALELVACKCGGSPLVLCASTPAEKVPFYLGQKVEIVRGFYRHRSGRVVAAYEGGSFRVKLDELPADVGWRAYDEVLCEASELEALKPRPTPAGCRVTIGGYVHPSVSSSAARLYLRRRAEPLVVCPHGKLVPRSWLNKGHTH